MRGLCNSLKQTYALCFRRSLSWNGPKPIRYIHKKKYHTSKPLRLSEQNPNGKKPAPQGQGLGPISWTGLALAGFTGAGIVYYFVTEKNKKQAAAVQRNTKAIGEGK